MASTSDTVAGVTASTDVDGLRQVLTFPGEPAVLWATSPLGDPGDPRVPGPTDYASVAVLDYGSEAEVAALVAGLQPSPGLANAFGWFPPALREADDDGITVEVYQGVPGFDPDQAVSVAPAAGRFVIVTYAVTT